MIDISFQGAKLTLEGPGFPKTNLVFEFGDEGSPIDFPDLETVGTAGTMNGILVTWSMYQPVKFRLTLIPGCESDKVLRRILYLGHIGHNPGKATKVEEVTIDRGVLTIPSITNIDSRVTDASPTVAGAQEFTFLNGRLTGGQPAISANAQGKMSSRVYNFVFESFCPPR